MSDELRFLVGLIGYLIAVERGFREANPLIRPFADSTWQMVAVKTGTVA